MISGATSSSVYKFLSAKYCFDEYLKRNRDSGEAWFLKAVCHVRAKEIAEAFECANRAIKSNPSLSSEVYILRAKLLWSKGLIEQASTSSQLFNRLNTKH